MLGGVIAFLVCVWFYQTADKLKLNPLPWIAGALIVYYGTKAAWTFLFLKPLMSVNFTHGSMIGGLLLEIIGAALGVLACGLFRDRVLMKQKQ